MFLSRKIEQIFDKNTRPLGGYFSGLWQLEFKYLTVLGQMAGPAVLSGKDLIRIAEGESPAAKVHDAVVVIIDAAGILSFPFPELHIAGQEAGPAFRAGREAVPGLDTGLFRGAGEVILHGLCVLFYRNNCSIFYSCSFVLEITGTVPTDGMEIGKLRQVLPKKVSTIIILRQHIEPGFSVSQVHHGAGGGEGGFSR